MADEKTSDVKGIGVKELYTDMVKELEALSMKELILLQQAIIQSMLRFV